MLRAFLWAPVWGSLTIQGWQGNEVFLSWSLIFGSALLSYSYDVLSLFYFQRTLGKFMLGMKVVSRNSPTASLSFAQSFLRPLVDRLDFFFGLSLRAFSFLRLDRTHPSDWLAETRVVSFVGDSQKSRRPFVFLFCLFWFGFAEFAEKYQMAQRIEIQASGILISTESVFDSDLAEIGFTWQQ
jgi:uncharacterized RDD family membrane protein YckC